MADVLYYDICQEHEALAPTTIAFCIQREGNGDTPQSVRCRTHAQPPGACGCVS
jgi:hypothetical protein